MGLRVYIAAPYRRARAVRALHTSLVVLGHTPSSRWAEGATEVEHLSDDIAAQAIAMNDHDVLTSDLLIVLGEEGLGREMWGEMRIACAMGIPVVYLGPDFLGAHRAQVIARGELTPENLAWVFRHALRCPEFLGTVGALKQVREMEERLAA